LNASAKEMTPSTFPEVSKTNLSIFPDPSGAPSALTVSADAFFGIFPSTASAVKVGPPAAAPFTSSLLESMYALERLSIYKWKEYKVL
jgi:hypothetical protein